MADALDEGGFWLPQFLTDDDLLVEKNKSRRTNNPESNNGCFGFETEGSKSFFPVEYSPHGLGSLDLSSPVESESDEEDFLSGLTLQMAQAALTDEVRRRGLSFGSEKTRLCPVCRGCGCCSDSPYCLSRFSSAPATWDLLYAAAGEVARMRTNEEAYRLGHGRVPFPTPSKPNPNLNLDVGGFDLHKKLHAAEMTEQRSTWGPQKQREALRNRGRSGHSEVVSSGSNGAGRPLNLSPSAWSPLRQTQNGSGMRAVFLGDNAAGRKECAGTGVFLPRKYGAPTENRKKSACSTVLLPARVVQALNLNLAEIGGQPQLPSRLNEGFDSDRDATVRLRSGNFVSNTQNLRPQQGMNHEVLLPQDWTY